MVDWFLSDNLTFTFYSSVEQGLVVIRAEASLVGFLEIDVSSKLPFRIIQIEEATGGMQPDGVTTIESVFVLNIKLYVYF